MHSQILVNLHVQGLVDLFFSPGLCCLFAWAGVLVGSLGVPVIPRIGPPTILYTGPPTNHHYIVHHGLHHSSLLSLLSWGWRLATTDVASSSIYSQCYLVMPWPSWGLRMSLASTLVLVSCHLADCSKANFRADSMTKVDPYDVSAYFSHP